MTITIRIVAVAERAVESKSVSFDAAGGTIGRRSDSTLVIPDQSRRVSRVHAVVSFHGNVFKIRDQGSFLPVYVNGHGVGFQRDMTIRPGDRIQIGPYTLEVAAAEGEATQPVAPAAPAKAEEPVTFSQVPFEVLEKRLAAAKASGLRLTTDNYPVTPDATSTQDRPFDLSATIDRMRGTPLAGSPLDPAPAVPEVSAIDLEPVGSGLVRGNPEFPPLVSSQPPALEASNEASSETPEPPAPEPSAARPARVISLLETARRVLGGRS